MGKIVIILQGTGNKYRLKNEVSPLLKNIVQFRGAAESPVQFVLVIELTEYFSRLSLLSIKKMDHEYKETVNRC